MNSATTECITTPKPQPGGDKPRHYLKKLATDRFDQHLTKLSENGILLIEV